MTHFMVLHKGFFGFDEFFLVILLMMRAGRCLEAAVWINYVVIRSVQIFVDPDSSISDAGVHAFI